ncbi:DNA mismatch repair protein MutS [Paraliomyxa miuraensis]|nr:DNA mismatch repair protein MutS [Paraliomyxa miuraensis]
MRARLDAVAARQRSVDRVSNLRVLTVVAGLLLGVGAWRDVVPGELLALPLLLFVALVIVHERLYRALAQAERAVEHYRAGLRRIDDAWAGHGETGQALAPADHPYAADLDLFGPGSLFELLCTARTMAGRRTLADWLLRPATLHEVRRRQAAVEALRRALDLRETLALAGGELDASIEHTRPGTVRAGPLPLVEWGGAPAALSDVVARRHGLLAWAVPASTLAVTAAWLWGPLPPSSVLAMVLVTWVVSRATGRFVQRAQGAAERSARELQALAEVLACLEGQRFEDPSLRRLHGLLVADEGSASRSIRRLAQLLAWAEIARSQLLAPVAFMLLWSLHFSLAIERWRRRHGPAIERWLGALGELEALLALSALAFEHPDDPFPELHEGEPVLEGEGLGHPLLPAATCVRNPVALGVDVPARIVSGSNMSGKSTYLRTVGINVVLALAGAPVRAHRMRLSALRIGATLRVQDSLQRGASRFFAEIVRLREIVAMADEGPGALFLIDEILHGTNSHDRRIGGHAIVRGLLDRGALGLVTTHDLALAAGTDDPRVDNVHFVDELRDGSLRFDYRLHPGVVRTSNALALMQAVGLPVSEGATASPEQDQQG